MSNPALQNAAMVWKIASPRDPIPCPSRAKRTVSATTPTSSTRKVMSATWPTRRATFLGVSGLASSSRTMRSSLNPMRRPIRSAPTVAAVIIPSPPSCMSAARIPCPTGVKASAGTTAWRPVTVTALTDSKKASSQVMPLFAPGIFSKNVPTTISPANASNMSLGAESRGNTSAGIPARSSSADVDGGASHGIRLGLPQDLVGDGGGVPLPEEEVAEQVHDGVSFGPAEVAVRRPASGVAQVEQQGGNGVGHHRALGAQHLVPADLHAPHLEHVLELRGVLHVDLEEQDREVFGYVVVLALLLLLFSVFSLVARLAPVGDDVDLSFVASLVDEALDRFGHRYPLLTQLERAVHPRDEGGEDHRHYEERGDYEPIGTLDLVRDESVDEDDGNQPEHQRPYPRAPAPGGERHREGGRAHHRQHACGVRPGLGVHVGPEDDGDDHRDGDVDDHEWANGTGPLRRHAVAGQISWHDVEQPGQGRSSGEGQDRDRGEIVGCSEHVTQVIVRQVGQ